MREVAEELAGETKALVDFEGTVDVGVVNETFPADSSTRFLEVV